MTSQTRSFPLCHGIGVSPSGRLPSRLFMPYGSLVVGIPAALRACQITSLSTWCLTVKSYQVLSCRPWRDDLRRLRRTHTGIYHLGPYIYFISHQSSIKAGMYKSSLMHAVACQPPPAQLRPSASVHSWRSECQHEPVSSLHRPLCGAL